MSKSLGNFFTLRDLVAKGFSGREIRFLLLTAHYRETFNFTLDGLSGARQSLARIDECIGKLREIVAREAAPAVATPDLLAAFAAALDDDLNISGAWGVVFEWVREMNRRLAAGAFPAAEAAAAVAAWEKIDAVLGVGAPAETGAGAPPPITALLEARQEARKAKDFKRSDAIREELKAKGWVIEDTPKGPRLKKL